MFLIFVGKSSMLSLEVGATTVIKYGQSKAKAKEANLGSK